MSQTSLTSYYTSRKRAASDDLNHCKNKVAHLEKSEGSKSISQKYQLLKKFELPNKDSKKITIPSEPKNEVVKQFEHVTTSTSNVAKTLPELVSQDKVVFGKKTNVNNDVHKDGEPSKSGSTSSARKELSLGDIRKRLAGSSRLAEIKDRAEKLSKGIQQLKEASEKKNLKDFKFINVEVPTSPSKKCQLQKEFLSPTKQAPVASQRPLISPRKVFVSPVKSPNKIPAYIRYAALASDPTTLPLPYHYRFLSELFRGMETVVALLFNRNEKITLAKLKPSIQEMLKRTFNDKHLAQIKHLVPDFYNFEVKKINNFSASSHKEAYEMTITPNFPNDIKVMNPTVLLERRRYFYDILLKLAKKHHAQYLLSLDPPMVIPEDKLSRWHPEFEIDKLPEIQCAKLPEMPNAEKYTSAQDVLARARDLFKCNTKMERALEKLAQAKARGLTEEEKAATGLNDPKPNSAQSTANVTLLNPALRNLPASLLEKVRAKQAAKALEAMTRPSDHEQKYAIYNRLPDLARTLRNIFVTERKNVLALNIILSKLESSFKANISASNLQRDIKTLVAEVPELVKLHEIRNNTYLKFDKNADLKKITAKLDDMASKYRQQ